MKTEAEVNFPYPIHPLTPAAVVKHFQPDTKKPQRSQNCSVLKHQRGKKNLLKLNERFFGEKKWSACLQNYKFIQS